MQIPILVAVAALAAVVSGVTGFGYGVVAMSVLPLFLSLRVLNPSITILSCANSLYVLATGRREVRWKSLLPLLLGAGVGIPLGIFLLCRLDDHAARRILGAVLVAYVAYDLLPVPKLRSGLSPLWGAGFGLLSGALGGAFAMGGPPVVIYFSLCGMSKEEMRPSLAAYFVMTYVYKIPLLVLGGFFTAEVGRTVLFMLLPTMAGVVAGQLLARRIPNRAFQKVLTAFLAATAVLYLAGG